MPTKQARADADPERKVTAQVVSDEEAEERERRDRLLRNGVVPEDFDKFLKVFKRWRATSGK